MTTNDTVAMDGRAVSGMVVSLVARSLGLGLVVGMAAVMLAMTAIFGK